MKRERLNQYFGVEVEFTGLTRQEAAETIGKFFGTTDVKYLCDGYYTWQVKDNQGRDWKVMRDGSVRAERGEQCEMVTPKLTAEDIKDLQQIIRNLRTQGAVVNSSCGIHIHIDGSNHDGRSLRNLAFIVNSKEELIAKALGVSESRMQQWCKRIEPKFISKLQTIKGPPTEDDIRKIWYDGYYSPQTDHYHQSRYHLLNYHSFFYRGTVEFRAFNSTLHAGKIRAYINFCLAISEQAITQKRAMPTKTITTNEKYTFRTWLLRMGMIGDEYKTTREHLLSNLSGNIAWRNGKPNKDGAAA